jgi:uncharacterized protein YdeI (YjbR/CyaY-like superfamily)
LAHHGILFGLAAFKAPGGLWFLSQGLTAKLSALGVPARMKPKLTPVLLVPAELAAALKKNAPAAKTFAGFSPSARRDYIEWITEAKRPETRRARLETAVQWIAVGKKRNWKDENC